MRKLENFENRPAAISRLGKVLTLAVLATALTLSGLRAGPAETDDKDMKSITPPPCGCTDKDWTLELGSGVFWSNVRSGQPNQAYTIVPITITASLKIDDVSLDHEFGGILRGYTEFFFRGEFDPILRGPETHYEGAMFGPRYNFVQPGWKLIPYAEGGVGFDFADSNPQQGGLGQDFNFSFIAGVGAKYCFTNDFYARLGVEYQHLSNAGLSEPAAANHPIDGLGPKLSFGYSF